MLAHQVSLFAELFNEMLQRDFGFRIYKALAAIPVKDDKKDKEKKVKKESEKRDVKKEKDEDGDELPAKKAKEDEDDKKKVSLSDAVAVCSSLFLYQSRPGVGELHDRWAAMVSFSFFLNLTESQQCFGDSPEKRKNVNHGYVEKYFHDR